MIARKRILYSLLLTSVVLRTEPGWTGRTHEKQAQEQKELREALVASTATRGFHIPTATPHDELLRRATQGTAEEKISVLEEVFQAGQATGGGGVPLQIHQDILDLIDGGASLNAQQIEAVFTVQGTALNGILNQRGRNTLLAATTELRQAFDNNDVLLGQVYGELPNGTDETNVVAHTRAAVQGAAAGGADTPLLNALIGHVPQPANNPDVTDRTNIEQRVQGLALDAAQLPIVQADLVNRNALLGQLYTQIQDNHGNDSTAANVVQNAQAVAQEVIDANNLLNNVYAELPNGTDETNVVANTRAAVQGATAGGADTPLVNNLIGHVPQPANNPDVTDRTNIEQRVQDLALDAAQLPIVQTNLGTVTGERNAAQNLLGQLYTEVQDQHGNDSTAANILQNTQNVVTWANHSENLLNDVYAEFPHATDETNVVAHTRAAVQGAAAGGADTPLVNSIIGHVPAVGGAATDRGNIEQRVQNLAIDAAQLPTFQADLAASNAFLNGVRTAITSVNTGHTGADIEADALTLQAEHGTLTADLATRTQERDAALANQGVPLADHEALLDIFSATRPANAAAARQTLEQNTHLGGIGNPGDPIDDRIAELRAGDAQANRVLTQVANVFRNSQQDAPNTSTDLIQRATNAQAAVGQLAGVQADLLARTNELGAANTLLGQLYTEIKDRRGNDSTAANIFQNTQNVVTWANHSDNLLNHVYAEFPHATDETNVVANTRAAVQAATAGGADTSLVNNLIGHVPQPANNPDVTDRTNVEQRIQDLARDAGQLATVTGELGAANQTIADVRAAVTTHNTGNLAADAAQIEADLATREQEVTNLTTLFNQVAGELRNSRGRAANPHNIVQRVHDAVEKHSNLRDLLAKVAGELPDSQNVAATSDNIVQLAHDAHAAKRQLAGVQANLTTVTGERDAAHQKLDDTIALIPNINGIATDRTNVDRQVQVVQANLLTVTGERDEAHKDLTTVTTNLSNFANLLNEINRVNALSNADVTSEFNGTGGNAGAKKQAVITNLIQDYLGQFNALSTAQAKTEVKFTPAHL